MSKGSGAQFITHAKIGYHHAGNLGSPANVILWPRSHFTEDNFLSSVPCQQCGQRILKLTARHEISIFYGQLPRMPERHASRYY